MAVRVQSIGACLAAVALLGGSTGAALIARDAAGMPPAATHPGTEPGPIRTDAPSGEGAVPLTPPSTELIRGLRNFDATLVPLATNSAQAAKASVPVPIERAIEISQGEVGTPGIGKPSSALLAKVTLGQYGRELEPDLSKPSRLDLIVADRSAWVIVYEDANIPVFGPMGGDDPTTVKQPLISFIDSGTGEFLGAVSY